MVLSRGTIDGVCERSGADVAIINPDDGYILGGRRDALVTASQEARSFNPRRISLLPVKVASHTRLLRVASQKFGDVLRAVQLPHATPADIRLLSGIDATSVADTASGVAKLSAQISQTVLWADCLQSCVEAGATSFLELGPGSALSQMVIATYPSLESRSLEDFRSIEGVRDWLSRTGFD